MTTYNPAKSAMILKISLTYRYFKHEMRHLSFMNDGLDGENVCPACLKVDHYAPKNAKPFSYI